jgi:hypothetical protein
MPLDYVEIANKFKPAFVKTLIIGEAPPANESTYFYIPKNPVKAESLSSAIFHHYFGKIPVINKEYELMLTQLKLHKIFFIDICDIPLRISNRVYKDGIDPFHLDILKTHIPKLRSKIMERKIVVEDENIIFLLPRQNYRSKLRKEFPKSQFYSLSDFRESRELLT